MIPALLLSPAPASMHGSVWGSPDGSLYRIWLWGQEVSEQKSDNIITWGLAKFTLSSKYIKIVYNLLETVQHMSWFRNVHDCLELVSLVIIIKYVSSGETGWLSLLGISLWLGSRHSALRGACSCLSLCLLPPCFVLSLFPCQISK